MTKTFHDTIIALRAAGCHVRTTTHGCTPTSGIMIARATRDGRSATIELRRDGGPNIMAWIDDHERRFTPRSRQSIARYIIRRMPKRITASDRHDPMGTPTHGWAVTMRGRAWLPLVMIATERDAAIATLHRYIRANAHGPTRYTVNGFTDQIDVIAIYQSGRRERVATYMP